MTMPLIRDTVEAINAEIDAGIDINTIINRYSTDRNEQNLDKGGYPVHPDSKNWPPEFLEAAGKLEKPGDLSGPVLTDMGVHILYYAADIPAGSHELTEEERQLLNTSALYYYQTQELEKLQAESVKSIRTTSARRISFFIVIFTLKVAFLCYCVQSYE